MRTPIKFYDIIPVKYHIGKHSLSVMESTHNMYLTHTRLDRVVRRLFPEEMTLELNFETWVGSSQELGVQGRGLEGVRRECWEIKGTLSSPVELIPVDFDWFISVLLREFVKPRCFDLILDLFLQRYLHQIQGTCVCICLFFNELYSSCWNHEIKVWPLT